MSRSARLHPDGKTRCPWPGEDPFYIAYHDTEWGVPEYDDRALYEKLILDGFQAGLSWITILRKRDNFRRAFDDFSPEPGQPILAGDKQVGTMGSTAGKHGLALIRTDRVSDALEAGVKLTAGGLPIRIAEPAELRPSPKQTVA